MQANRGSKPRNGSSVGRPRGSSSTRHNVESEKSPGLFTVSSMQSSKSISVSYGHVVRYSPPTETSWPKLLAEAGELAAKYRVSLSLW